MGAAGAGRVALGAAFSCASQSSELLARAALKLGETPTQISQAWGPMTRGELPRAWDLARVAKMCPLRAHAFLWERNEL